MNAGFVGLGNIGGSIARDLIASKNGLVVYDARQEIVGEFGRLGATPAASAAELGALTDADGICVLTDDEVLDVMNWPEGIRPRSRRTCSVGSARKAAAAVVTVLCATRMADR